MTKEGPSQDAVSTTFAAVIAISILALSIFAVFTATDNIASSNVVQEAEQVNLQSEAASLQRILLDSPGVVAGGDAWDGADSSSADDVLRLGLLDPTNSTIQLEKLANLRLAPYAADADDGYANYDEVRTAMGLDEKGLDFHIRTKPVLRSAADVLADPSLRDQDLKITYIGNIAQVPDGTPEVDDGLVIDSWACFASPTGSPSWRFTVALTNGGTTSTQFFLVMDIDGGELITRQDQSNIVAPGDTVVVNMDVENLDGFTCDGATTAEVDIIDPIQLIRSTTLSLPTVGSGPSAAPGEFYAVTGEPSYGILDDVDLYYYGDIAKNDDLTLEVREGTDPNGTLAYSTTESVPAAQSSRVIDIPAIALGVGDYTAYLTHSDMGITTTQHFVVSLLDLDPYTPVGSVSTTYEEGGSVALETRFLSDLVLQFCPVYYNDANISTTGDTWVDRCSDWKADIDPAVTAAQPGDVFPAIKPDLRELEARLIDSFGAPRYDVTRVLVIGSDVPHNIMTDNNIGGPIEDWVLGGGTLVVFGSPDQSTQWLQDLFHVGQTSSSGGISAPDVGHPLISIPEQLAFEEYETSGYGWSYSAGADDYFTDVVTEGDTPITVVSDPGDFGEGTVVLSSWRPYDLFGSGGSDDEGIRMVYNFVMHGYRDLFVDYGPLIPDGVPAIPATGRGLVDHPDLGPVTLDFNLYVFPSGS